MTSSNKNNQEKTALVHDFAAPFFQHYDKALHNLTTFARLRHFSVEANSVVFPKNIKDLVVSCGFTLIAFRLMMCNILAMPVRAATIEDMSDLYEMVSVRVIFIFFNLKFIDFRSGTRPFSQV